MTERGSSPEVLEIRDWGGLYENNRSRELARTEWYPAPNDLSSYGYVELVSHPDGAAHLGVWSALLMVASRAEPRGQLVREDGRGHTPESLSRVTRLPEDVIQAAIKRLLEIGLLQRRGRKPNKKNKIQSHPDAARAQEGATEAHADAARAQEGATEAHADAAEGNGREHHHQEQKINGTERTYNDSKSDGASFTKTDSQKNINDDDGDDAKLAVDYASPDDELKAIYEAKAGQRIPVHVLDTVRKNLQGIGVEMRDFVAEVRNHAGGRWRNPAGFLLDLSKHFRSKTIVSGPPVTAAEEAARDYHCNACASTTPGEGALLVNGKPTPCACASPEYIARQRARGLFTENTPKDASIQAGAVGTPGTAFPGLRR
jgi:hypothetical protein